MPSNYIKNFSSRNLLVFYSIYSRSRFLDRFWFYYNYKCSLILVNYFLNFTFKSSYWFFSKKYQQLQLYITIRSVFEKGLIRDLIRLNLFIYKLKSFWTSVFIDNIKEKNKQQLTLLRSPFVNKKARLQYCLKEYICRYALFFKNIWLLHCILFFLSKFFFKYSKITYLLPTFLYLELNK